MVWAIGQRLQSGKYTIEALLGEGGFGITYLARDSVWNPVVIKTLNDKVKNHPRFDQLQQDFVNEALWLAKCSHPHVVQVHRTFQEEGQWCMVMEYIAGEDLGSRVKQRGVFSESEAIYYIRQVGEALSLMHQHGLLHRDVKPENIMLRAGKPEVVLLDLGIAREFVPNSTQTHTAILSNGYAPIEQYEYQARRGAYSDVYGLAATLYSLLTGRTPVDATIRMVNLQRQGADPLEVPQVLNPHISDATQRAILQGLAIEAHDRPQSVEAWLSLLPISSEVPQVQPVPSFVRTQPPAEATAPIVPPQTAMYPQSAMVTLPFAQPISPPDTADSSPASDRPLERFRPKTVAHWVGLGVGLAIVAGSVGVAVSRWLLYQRAETTLARLEQLNADGEYAACLSKATNLSRTLSSDEQTQAIVNLCAEGLLNQAKQQAEQSQWQEALRSVGQIPANSPVSQEAQSLTEEWSDQLLQRATQLYESEGKLDEALALLEDIPTTTKAGQQVEDTTTQWQEAWSKNQTLVAEAKQSLEAGAWYEAREQANTVTTPYWQAQVAEVVQAAEAEIAAIEAAQQQEQAAAADAEQEVAFATARDRCEASDASNWRADCQEFEQLCQERGGAFVADATFVGCHTGAEEDKLPPQPDKPAKPENPVPPPLIETPPPGISAAPATPPAIPRLDR